MDFTTSGRFMYKQATASYPPAPGTSAVTTPGSFEVASQSCCCGGGSIGTTAASPMDRNSLRISEKVSRKEIRGESLSEGHCDAGSFDRASKSVVPSAASLDKDRIDSTIFGFSLDKADQCGTSLASFLLCSPDFHFKTVRAMLGDSEPPRTSANKSCKSLGRFSCVTMSSFHGTNSTDRFTVSLSMTCWVSVSVLVSFSK
mmetsp:Transcript_16464/g.33837  ORF Transcript_16464/g.33837 Transcript_16464/m.33837 type:complete len:201 (-) Transcript_16464:822-1424(-)